MGGGIEQETSVTRESRAVVLTTVAASAALGVVAGSLMGWDPLSPFVAASTPRAWDGYTVLAEVVPMLGVLVALFTSRWWPWLLLAGTVVSLPLTAYVLFPTLGSHVSVLVAAKAGPPMVLIAVLAAAQELFRRGARTAGFVVAGLAIGSQVFAAALTGSTWFTQPAGMVFWHVALTVVGIGGVVLAIVTRGPRAADPGWTASAQLRPRVAIAAVGAVLLPLVAVYVDPAAVSGLLKVSEGSLSRHPDVVPTIVALIVLVGAVLLGTLAGARVFFGVAVMALTQLGVTGPLILALYSAAVDPVSRWIAAAIGVAAGCVAAASRWREQLAVGGGVLSALVLFVAAMATGGTPEKLIDQQLSVVGSLLLALLAATATVMVASASRALAELDALPAAFGPLTSVLVLSGSGALVATQIDDQNYRGYLAAVHYLPTYAGLLLLAAGLIAGAAGVRFLRARPAAEPALG